MGKTWTTTSQKEFLLSKVPDFVSAQLKDTLDSDFRPKLWTEWFQKHEEVNQPEDAATAEEKELYAQHVVARKKQLDSWFYNDATSRKKKGTVSDKIIAKITKSPKKGSCTLTAIQKFSAEHYNSLVKPLVDQKLLALSAETPGGKLPKGSHIPIITQTTKEVWESLEDGAKEKFLKKSEEIEEDISVNTDGPKIIHDFLKYISTIGNQLRGATNWAVSILVGGWDDEQKQILTHAFHAGENELGLLFCAANPLYQEHVLDPFSDFTAAYVKAERSKNPNAYPPVGPPKMATNGMMLASPSALCQATPSVPVGLVPVNQGDVGPTSLSPAVSGAADASANSLSPPRPHVLMSDPSSVPALVPASLVPASSAAGSPVARSVAGSPVAGSPVARSPVARSPVEVVTQIDHQNPSENHDGFPLDPVLSGIITPIQSSSPSVQSDINRSLFPYNLGPSESVEEAYSQTGTVTVEPAMGAVENIGGEEGRVEVGSGSNKKARGKGSRSANAGGKRKAQEPTGPKAPKKQKNAKVTKKKPTGKENVDPNIPRATRSRVINPPQRYTQL
ncbi:hypothetical protein K435DRAFT_799966 [Dendrothele bispora CBS 962.96]|uniref:Uncharacterized protein n=1 Tax=Dendrothele bispora (strain CBS 962.96) TaxID=1314807 RepID=A0A4S8LUN5_DENBC|nr:hypothetical protein K435DRAFT_799966 [Dendrothele bispora CBS 962.96]